MLFPPQVPAILLAAAPLSQPPLAATILVGGILGAIRRRQPIGGWLFFFFWQMLLSCVVTVAYTNWAQFRPRLWTDQVRYLVFMVVTGPRLMMMFTVAMVAIVMLKTRHWEWVVVLRYALTMLAAFGLATVIVDKFYFPDRMARELGTLLFPVAYAFYFQHSLRVRHVFAERSTPQPVGGIPPLPIPPAV